MMYRGSLLKPLKLGSCPGSRRAPADIGRFATTWGASGGPRSGIQSGALEVAMLLTRGNQWKGHCVIRVIGRETLNSWGPRRVCRVNVILYNVVSCFCLLY